MPAKKPMSGEILFVMREQGLSTPLEVGGHVRALPELRHD